MIASVINNGAKSAMLSWLLTGALREVAIDGAGELDVEKRCRCRAEDEVESGG